MSFKNKFFDYSLLLKIISIKKQIARIRKIKVKKREKRPYIAKFVKTWSRSSSVSRIMLGFTIAVYNGKKFIPVIIKKKMIGHKLGEFSPTRTYSGHSKKKKGKKIKKR